MNMMVINMYIAPGWGHMSPWGALFLESLIFSPTAHFLQDFYLKVFPIQMHWRPMLTLP